MQCQHLDEKDKIAENLEIRKKYYKLLLFFYHLGFKKSCDHVKVNIPPIKTIGVISKGNAGKANIKSSESIKCANEININPTKTPIAFLRAVFRVLIIMYIYNISTTNNAVILKI